MRHSTWVPTNPTKSTPGKKNTPSPFETYMIKSKKMGISLAQKLSDWTKNMVKRLNNNYCTFRSCSREKTTCCCWPPFLRSLLRLLGNFAQRHILSLGLEEVRRGVVFACGGSNPTHPEDAGSVLKIEIDMKHVFLGDRESQLYKH